MRDGTNNPKNLFANSSVCVNDWIRRLPGMTALILGNCITDAHDHRITANKSSPHRLNSFYKTLYSFIPVRLDSLWDRLKCVIEVVSILKSLHQDIIVGLQDNDFPEK